MKYITKLYSLDKVYIFKFSRKKVYIFRFSRKKVYIFNFIIFALLNWNLTFTKLYDRSNHFQGTSIKVTYFYVITQRINSARASFQRRTNKRTTYPKTKSESN
jgi:hypothetical protein